MHCGFYLREAAIFLLLLEYPLRSDGQVILIDRHQWGRLRERLQNKVGQPHASFGVTVSECTVRTVVVTVAQLTLVPYNIETIRSTTARHFSREL